MAVTNSYTIRSSNGVDLGILIPQMAIPHFSSIVGFVAKALNRPGYKPAITTKRLIKELLQVGEVEFVTVANLYDRLE